MYFINYNRRHYRDFGAQCVFSISKTNFVLLALILERIYLYKIKGKNIIQRIVYVFNDR